ncbi:hypothetical protein [Afipia carboxidovorans]|uniref:hypothetical protein n=1 Tax=Afipia carboxidovorans TaxID=40137 RepID=UPI00308BF66A|nr:hypothetical protein CRBSH125_05830 [Afipia carboxidovorans]
MSICLNGVFEENGEIVSYRLPTADQRVQLEKRERQLSAILQPASSIRNGHHRLGLAITAMLAGFLNAKSADPKATTAAYVTELQRYPAWAVERACRAVGSGEVPGLSPDFPPSAARIAQIAQSHLDEHYAERTRIQTVLTAKLAYQPSQGERERIAEGFKEISDRLRQKDDGEALRRKAEADQRSREASAADICRTREAAGLPPPAPGALPVSPSLLKTLANVEEPPREAERA